MKNHQKVYSELLHLLNISMTSLKLSGENVENIAEVLLSFINIRR